VRRESAQRCTSFVLSRSETKPDCVLAATRGGPSTTQHLSAIAAAAAGVATCKAKFEQHWCSRSVQIRSQLEPTGRNLFKPIHCIHCAYVGGTAHFCSNNVALYSRSVAAACATLMPFSLLAYCCGAELMGIMYLEEESIDRCKANSQRCIHAGRLLCPQQKPAQSAANAGAMHTEGWEVE